MYNSVRRWAQRVFWPTKGQGAAIVVALLLAVATRVYVPYAFDNEDLPVVVYHIRGQGVVSNRAVITLPKGWNGGPPEVIQEESSTIDWHLVTLEDWSILAVLVIALYALRRGRQRWDIPTMVVAVLVHAFTYWLYTVIPASPLTFEVPSWAWLITISIFIAILLFK
jgi:hypothetical protein